MEGIPETTSSLLSRVFWTADPTTLTLLWLLLGIAGIAFVAIHGSLAIRLVRISLLRRAVRAASEGYEFLNDAHRDEIAAAFAASPLASHFEDFLIRWKATRAPAATSDGQDRAPLSLADVLEDRPALPRGARRSLLPALPALFLALGALGTFVGFALGFSETTEPGLAAGRVALSLQTALWGLVLSLVASGAGRWLIGRYEAQSEALDRLVERAHPSLSPAEFATASARAQREGFDRMSEALGEVARELGKNIDKGLSRIERSSSKAASLVSEEQRKALRSVVNDLGERVRLGVDEHLSALRQALQQAVEHQGAVTGGILETYERLEENSEAHARVTASLSEAAGAVSGASDSLRSTAQQFEPVLEQLHETGRALEETSNRIGHTQDVAAITVDSVRTSLEHASGAIREQRQFVELSLTEIRSTLELLSQGLGENLSQALRSVDDVLDDTIGRLRETILESNETIDRLSVPIRAAEGTTLEMHTALERVRADVGNLSDWLIQAVKPVRATLTQLESKTGAITRALGEFGDRAQNVDKTLDALRASISEEGQSFRSTAADLGTQLQIAAEAMAANTPPGQRPPRRDPVRPESPAPDLVERGSARAESRPEPSPDPSPPAHRPPTPPRATLPLSESGAEAGTRTGSGLSGSSGSSGSSGLSGLLSRPGGAEPDSSEAETHDDDGEGEGEPDRSSGSLRRLFRKD